MAARNSRKITAKQTAKPVKRKKGATRRAGDAGRSLLPVFLSACILFCIGVFVYMGYRSVTASNFFEVAKIEVNGTSRASRENIERLVMAEAARTGVWNADLADIRGRVEKLPFVRSAAVTRVLPNGLRVEVFEHEPKAVVRTQSGNMLVDKDGRMIAKAEEKEPALPMTLTGWDEAKSEKADKDNAERVKLYQKMLTDWKAYGVAERVMSLDLSDIRDPRAVIEDSGAKVVIAVGRENFAENLTRGIKAIAGKGKTFEAVDLVGTNMILAPRKSEAK